MKKILQLIFLIFFLVQAGKSQQTAPTYVLVHGAWHGAWCWHKVIPLMADKGFKAVAIDLPGHGHDTTDMEQVTFTDYISGLMEATKSIEGQLILVGHSMGGTVISQAAEFLGSGRVQKLIYVDAFLPRNGESVSSLANLATAKLQADGSKLSVRDGLKVSVSGKTSTFKPDVADQLFYHDCSEQDKSFAHQNLCRQAFEPLGAAVKVSDSVYGSIPKYYILCTESRDLDKSVFPQRVECADVVKLHAGHSPFFSQPEKLVDIIIGF